MSKEPQNPNAALALPDAKNMTFVQNIIERTLPNQPRWVQAIILFLFVFLFIYIVVFTMNASIVLPTEVQVSLWCRPESGWNSVWRISSNMKVSFQAARSIG